MGRARVVAPPPQDHIPEPLVSAPPPPEEVVAEEEESKVAAETIAKAKEILENPPIVIEKVIETVIETVHVTDPKLVEELQILKEENKKLARENDAAVRAKEEQILKVRQQATEQRSNQHIVQLNMTPKIPSLISKIKTVFRNRRIKSATNVGIKNYETAILERARIAVPKLLDDIEKMHEQLTILEDLLTKYSEVKSTQEK